MVHFVQMYLRMKHSKPAFPFLYCVLVASIWMLLLYGFWNQTEKSLFSTYLAYNPDDFNSRTLHYNQIQRIMDVITIESKAYHELMGKIEKIVRYNREGRKGKGGVWEPPRHQ